MHHHPTITSPITVTRIFDIIHCENSLFLVFEYLDQDLKIFLDSSKNLLSKRLVKSFLWQLLQALAYCHANLIIHRDLKPQNLLIDKHMKIKLADFGLGKLLADDRNDHWLIE